MSPIRPLCAALIAVLATAGCTEEAAAPVSVPPPEVVTDLAFNLPVGAEDARMAGEVRELPPGEGPARSLSPDEPEPDEQAMASILSASTDVGFTSEYAYSAGRHRYTGNNGRVETEAKVAFDGVPIGTQMSYRQDYTPFLLDWGQIHSIWTEAYIFVDQDCGLRVDGESDHTAWWSWFLGGPSPKWGNVGDFTQAFPPVSQPPCEEEEEEPDTDHYVGPLPEGPIEVEGGWISCWYLITYDVNTGEILDAELLYCDDVEYV